MKTKFTPSFCASAVTAGLASINTGNSKGAAKKDIGDGPATTAPAGF